VPIRFDTPGGWIARGLLTVLLVLILGSTGCCVAGNGNGRWVRIVAHSEEVSWKGVSARDSLSSCPNAARL
jgi:hypothetical protein